MLARVHALPKFCRPFLDADQQSGTSQGSLSHRRAREWALQGSLSAVQPWRRERRVQRHKAVGFGTLNFCPDFELWTEQTTAHLSCRVQRQEILLVNRDSINQKSKSWQSTATADRRSCRVTVCGQCGKSRGCHANGAHHPANSWSTPQPFSSPPVVRRGRTVTIRFLARTVDAKSRSRY